MVTALAAASPALAATAAGPAASAGRQRSRAASSRTTDAGNGEEVETPRLPRKSRKQVDKPAQSTSQEVTLDETIPPPSFLAAANLGDGNAGRNQGGQRRGWAARIYRTVRSQIRGDTAEQSSSPNLISYADVIRHPLFSLFTTMAVAAVITSFLLHWTPVKQRSMVSPGDILERLDGLESNVKRSLDIANALQVQEAIQDHTLQGLEEKHKLLEAKFDDKVGALQTEVSKLDGKISTLDSSVQQVMAQSGPAVKEEILALVENRAHRSLSPTVSLLDIRDAAKDVVERELAIYSADRIGRPDYALASGGATVLDHSRTLTVGRTGVFWALGMLPGRKWLHPLAMKVLTPSAGVPGQCLPLMGSNGTIDIALRTTIMPTAVTLDHIAESISFGINSAPRDCQLLGWKEDAKGGTTAPQVLLNFTYKLGDAPVQTFAVANEPSSTVNRVRLKVLSNHGSKTHTCVYRIRVHGTPSLLEGAF